MTSVQGRGINRPMSDDASAERLVVREGSTPTFTLRDLGHRVLREVTWSFSDGWRWGKDYIDRGGTLLASQSPRAGEGLLYHRCVMSSPSPSLPPSGVLRTWEPTNCRVSSWYVQIVWCEEPTPDPPSAAQGGAARESIP